MRIHKKCEWCGRGMYLAPTSKRKFCSKNCSGKNSTKIRWGNRNENMESLDTRRT